MSQRLLFLKERMAWPRASGHDVHTFYMMQALAKLGHDVALCTIDEPVAEAIANCGLEQHYSFKNQSSDRAITLNKWENKFRNYWGVDENAIRWVGDCAADFQADAVIVSGLRVLPYLGAIGEAKAVWYAADEWVWHHLSQFRPWQRRTWNEFRQGIDKGLYERAFRRRLDRVWVVSQKDARAFRWFAGIGKLDVIPNGVDANQYTPGPEEPLPNSCIFWGRLDFGPNIQAMEWFLKRVWPRVQKTVAARFDVFGFQPTPQVVELCKSAKVTLTADCPDLRSEVRRRQIVVLPFISGGGIKNKLLEAAALGRPILATPRVTEGLNGTPPIVLAKSPATFAAELTALFKNPSRQAELGNAARAWVMEHHTWDAAARIAAAGLT